MDTPKERKFIECFKSNCTGRCNHCKVRSWNKGNKIYAMKTISGNQTSWIVCTDRKCYLEQGGKLTLFQKQTISDKVKCLWHGDVVTKFYDVTRTLLGVIPSRTRCEYCKEWLK